MNFKFESIQDMKEFAKSLSVELKSISQNDLSSEVLEFKSNFYVTSSEYFGEFRIVLKKVQEKCGSELSQEWVASVNSAIHAINKAFSN